MVSVVVLRLVVAMRDAGVADDGGFGITTTLDFADQCSASIAMRRPVLCIPYDLIRFR